MPGGIEVRAPKYGSERVVYLPDDLVSMLSEHVRTIGVRPDGWLFVGTGDGPPHKDQVSYLVAQDADRRGPVGGEIAYPQAFLRQRVDRSWLRCGDGAAGAGAFVGDNHAEHLPPSVADGGGPHPQSISGHDENLERNSCGLCAD